MVTASHFPYGTAQGGWRMNMSLTLQNTKTLGEHDRIESPKAGKNQEETRRLARQ
jgi:hypothetical protein